MVASYTLIGSLIGLSLLGYYADKWLSTEPWLLLLGVILGLVIGLYAVAKVSLKK
ncbi:MAG: AtpZ/AtpI family protein [Candidatus Marinimicrobia bacterium]|nr:AtpZ/AtpI family protein [Candidatus Neomarinimicrobiota bacterium]